MKPFLVQEYKQNITELLFLQDEHVGVIHLPNAFRILDKKKNYRMSSGMSVKSEEFREGTQAVDISLNGEHIASGDNKEKILNVISLESRSYLYKLERHTGEIESVIFDPKQRYLISGGTDGQVLLWGMGSGDFIGRLPAHGDYVTTMTISQDGIFAITGAYNGTICINNLNTQSKPRRLKLGDYRINRIVFISGNRILIGTSSNEVVIMDYLRPKIIKRIATNIDNINGLTTIMDDKYLLVSGETLKVPVYDLESGEQLSPHMIVVGDEITRLAYNPDDHTLLISTRDGRLYFYNITDDSELRELIDAHDYKGAYELISHNPMMLYSKEYERLESVWDKACQNAMQLLKKNLNDEANKVLEPFRGILQKNSKIGLLLKDFRDYENFKQLIREKKYARAYSVAENAPTVKETEEYAQLEKIWEQAFEKAKKVLITEQIGITPKEILKDFASVTSKTGLVQTLTRNAGVYLSMVAALKEKNFRAFFSVVAKHKFLMKTREYENTMALGDWLGEQIREKLIQKDFATAIDGLETLRQFMHMDDLVQEAELVIKAARHFFHFYKAGQILNCYKLIDDYPLLLRYEEAQKLEKQWQEKIVQIEKMALQGNARAVLDLFTEFSDLHARYGKISSLLKLAYLSQLKMAIAKKYAEEKSYQKAFKIYATLFGYDLELAEISEMLTEAVGIDILLQSSEEAHEKDIIKTLTVNKDKIPSKIIPFE